MLQQLGLEVNCPKIFHSYSVKTLSYTNLHKVTHTAAV